VKVGGFRARNARKKGKASHRGIGTLFDSIQNEELPPIEYF
jgi:hypothetical protein